MRLAYSLWLLAAAAGLALMTSYGGVAGAGASAPARWPSSTRINLESSGTLLLFVHPQCPCTAATLNELARVTARSPIPPKGTIIFYSPREAQSAWVESKLWDSAKRIPGLKVKHDGDGREARTFGVRTSGQVLWYDKSGTLKFAGGITPSRGHEGDSVGKFSLLALLRENTPQQAESAVFGCPLLGECRNGASTDD